MSKKTIELKKLLDVFEKERDALLDKVQYLKGNADRIEWVIRVINAQIHNIEKQESENQQIAEKYQQALQTAREKGNIGSHPSQRKLDLQERKNQAKQQDGYSAR